MNPYAYVSDNPETKNDPTGHWGWGVIALVVAIVVVVAVVAIVAAPVLIAAASATAEVAADGAAVGAVAEGAGDVAGAAAEETASTVAENVVEDAGEEAVENGVENATENAAEDAAPKDPSTEANSETNTESDSDDGCSFTPQTQVGTAQGQVPIGQLKVGQKVWAWNQTTHKMELEPIQHVWIDKDSDLVDLTVAQIKHPHARTVIKKPEVIHTNQKHPFLTTEKGFLPVGQIKVGMHLIEADGSVGIVVNWQSVAGTMTMYNLEVTQDHTFTVGDGHWIVHNECNRQQLRNRMGTGDGYAAHHVIPCELEGDPLFQESGMDINSADNGINLPTTEDGSLDDQLPYHDSQHPAYTNYIKGLLEEGYDDLDADGNLNQGNALDAVRDVIARGQRYIAELGQWISENGVATPLR
jgi:hypothetical protein